jgi:hypothetical protein
VNILITHDPYDFNENFINLRKKLKELKIHCWGHVQYIKIFKIFSGKNGFKIVDDVLLINAANDNNNNNDQEPPFYFDFYYD